MAQIVLERIRKSYPLGGATVVAVEEVSLSIEKGQWISIIGHSGSGKTTLLSILGGILGPTSGKLLVDGADIFGLSEVGLSRYRAEKVGYVFQFASLLPVLTARENLLLPNIFRGGGNGRVDEKKAVSLLGMVGLADKANAYPTQLSGGQQRRVAIARSLMNDPEVILADEPTGDLDEETEAEVMKFFKQVNRERGITFVLVTHSTELAAGADRRFRMTHGRVEELR